MALSLSSLTSAQLSLGCYASGVVLTSAGSTLQQPPILQGLSPPYQDIFMSQGLCTNYCKTNQYKYAITQNGTACLCSNQQPSASIRVDTALCNKPCAGYPFEMCGSDITQSQTSAAGSTGAYVNVMLVGNTLENKSSSDPVLSSVKNAQSTLDETLSYSKMESSSVEGNQMPESRKDHEGSDDHHREGDIEGEKNNDDEDHGSKVKNKSYHKDGDDTTENDDEDDDDDSDDGEEVNESTHAPSGSDSSRGIPIATTIVGVGCLIGIVSFFIYWGRKRKRERMREAWVDSVFGTTGGSCDGNRRTNSRSSGQWHTDDTESSFDNTSEVVERRKSAVSGHLRANDAFIRSIQAAAVMRPPIKRASAAMPTASNASYGQTTIAPIHHPLPAAQMQEFYPEFYDGGDDYEDAQLSYSDEYLVPESLPANVGRMLPTQASAVAHSLASPLQRPPNAVLPGLVTVTPGNISPLEEYHTHRGYAGMQASEVTQARVDTISLPIGYGHHTGHHSLNERSTIVPLEQTLYDVSPSVDPFQEEPIATVHPLSPCPPSHRADKLSQYSRRPLHPLHSQYRNRPIHRHSFQSLYEETLPTGVWRDRYLSSHPSYRRPYSFTGSHDALEEEREKALGFRTRFLCETDTEGPFSESESRHDQGQGQGQGQSQGQSQAEPLNQDGDEGQTNIGLTQRFKKISIPYVQAIRQQQLEYHSGFGRRNSTGSIGGDSFTREMGGDLHVKYRHHKEEREQPMAPAPGPAPATERRWSRVLKNVGKEFSQRSRGPPRDAEQGANGNGGYDTDFDDGSSFKRGTKGRPSRHRQVHSGSLASFRGLGDPSHPRLRVTNPDRE